MATTEISPEGCPIHRFTVHSPAMDRDIKVVVVLPPEYDSQPEKRYPILHTLHGMDAPFDTFSAMVPLRQALRDKPVIVTCIDADHASFYLDSPHLQNPGRDPQNTTRVKSLFTTFFLHEFIPAIERDYRVDPAHHMLTGFSMGGYGALLYMLAAPGKFSSVSSLSGWFDDMSALPPEMIPDIERLLGPHAENPESYAAHDIFRGIEKQKAAGIKFPPIYLACGTEDSLLQQNIDLHAFLTKHGIANEYHATAGTHDWPYWRDASPAVLDFHWRSLARKP